MFESDFSRLLGAMLPHYFKYDNGWIIAPEIWSLDKRKSDFVVSKTNINRHGPKAYGESIIKLMAESKKPIIISWQELVKEQLWNQAESLMNDEGRLWVIGQIGYYICFFKFDIQKYNESEFFRNFSPVNLRNFTPEQLDDFKILHITESLWDGVNSRDVIQVIQWDVRNTDNRQYIDEMFIHIMTNDV